MAFTNYKTWSAGETLTAANFNAQIRDNGLTMPPHLLVRKTADQSTTSTTTVSDSQLVTPSIAASEVWRLEWEFNCVTSTGQFKVSFTFPTGGVLAATINGILGDRQVGGDSSPTSTYTIDSNNSTWGTVHNVKALFTNSTTPGAVTFQFASSNGSNCTIKANATLWGVKLA